MFASNNFNLVEIAVEICTKDAFKVEVFSDIVSSEEAPENRKKIWDETVAVAARSLLEEYPRLERDEKEAVIGLVLSIAFRMLRWIEFYVGFFGFTRDFCVEFLDSPLFATTGIIDPSRVEAKMAEKQISNMQKFKLACFYCQWRTIPALFNNLSPVEKKSVYNEKEPELVIQPDIVKFWSYHSMGELEMLKGTDKLEQFRQKVAVTSGSKLAIDFCVARTRSKQNCVTDIAVSLFRHRVHREIKFGEYFRIVDDWIVFGNKKYTCSEMSWIPDSFFADIFYSLFSGMSEPQRTDFWRLICNTKFILSDTRITQRVLVRVLECLLCFPHQEMFLELMKSSWSRLSLSVFSYLLSKILNRIEPECGQLWYGEEKFYDYRKLFSDLWIESPKPLKKVLFKEYEHNILLLIKIMYDLKTFNERDRKNIKLLIESPREEKVKDEKRVEEEVKDEKKAEEKAVKDEKKVEEEEVKDERKVKEVEKVGEEEVKEVEKVEKEHVKEKKVEVNEEKKVEEEVDKREEKLEEEKLEEEKAEEETKVEKEEVDEEDVEEEKIREEVKEKEKGFDYIKSEPGIFVATMLLERKRLDLFNELISTCLISPDRIHYYTLKVILLKAMNDCLEMLKQGKWHEAEETLKWSEYELTQEEILSLKRELISSKKGKETCIGIWKADPDVAEKFILWGLPPEQMFSFKCNLINSEVGLKECRELCIVSHGKADNLVQWCLPPQSIRRFKAKLIHDIGSLCMCTKYALKGNSPELADKLILWCLPRELLRAFKTYLGYNLEIFPIYKTTFDDIENCTDDEFPDKLFDWKPAEKLFAWCFAAPDSTENTVASVSAENITASDTTENIIASDAAENISVSDSGGKINASDSEEGKILASGAEGKLVASGAEEKLVASGAEEKLVASGAEEKLVALVGKLVASVEKLVASVEKLVTSVEKLAASRAAEKLAASGAEEKVAASGAEEKVAASGAEEKLAASGAEEKLAASGAEEKLAATVAEEKLVVSGAEEKLVASGAEEKIVASGAEEEKILASGTEETIASRAEGEKILASDQKEIPFLDLAEIKRFKRHYLIKFRREIIYKCIESNNWNVADKFLSWLHLDAISFRMLKIEQICSDVETGELLTDLMCRSENDPKFTETGGKQRTIERFIHWFLVDASIVEEFIKRLSRYSDEKTIQNIIMKLKQSDDIDITKKLLMSS